MFITNFRDERIRLRLVHTETATVTERAFTVQNQFLEKKLLNILTPAQKFAHQYLINFGFLKTSQDNHVNN